MSKMLTLDDVILEANKVLDTEPVFDKNFELYIENPSKINYDDLIEISMSKRYISFKYRVPEQLHEYHLIFQPWRGGFDLTVWNDGPGGMTPDNSPAIGTIYNITEEQFFQWSTIKNLHGATFETIKNVEKLQKRFYEYVELTPCEQEKFDGPF